MAGDAPFSRVAVLGSGLIGGSFALALRRHLPAARIIGWDRPEILSLAKSMGAIDEAAPDAAAAIPGADLVYIALPVGAALEILPKVATHSEPKALVTDACGTKSAICSAAAELITRGVRFLGGHPMTGKETSGLENADREIFRTAPYALVGSPQDSDERIWRFVALVREIGAEPIWCDAETHDRSVALISHLPQLASVALARVVLDAIDETGLPVTLAGRGLRDVLRLTGSSYAVWRDICLTNTENISRALDQLCQALEHLRTNLRGRQLDEEFQAANELYKILHKLQ